MKIKPLLKKASGKYDLADIPEKINEIIDLLNNSFITQDADTAIFEPQGLYDDIKCPNCGGKYFEVGPSMSTCVYYPPIIKDGVNINPDMNTITTEYHCLECGKDWVE